MSNYKVTSPELVDRGNEVMRLFGRKVRRISRSKKWSQEDLAIAAGIHRNYVSDMERGQRNVSLKIVDRLAKALEVPVKVLFEDFD